MASAPVLFLGNPWLQLNLGLVGREEDYNWEGDDVVLQAGLRALYSGDLDALEDWCANGRGDVDINKHVISTRVGRVETLLFHAITRPSAMRILLRHGSDVNHRFNSEILFHASAWARVESVALLLDAGLPVDLDYHEVGRSVPPPLFHAVQDGNLALVRLLIHRGANPDLRFNSGYTPEERAQRLAQAYPGTEYRGFEDCRRFLASVRLAGGYKRYVREPRIQLMVLRALCERGRARAPRGVLARVFGESSARARRGAGPVLTKYMFWRICLFWRSSRDWAPEPDKCGPEPEGPWDLGDESDGDGSSVGGAAPTYG